MDETTRIFEGLLTRAAAAHGVHEKEVLGGVYDDQWPQWYAAHMSAALDGLGLRVVSAGDSGAETSAGEERGETAQPAQ